MTPGLALRRQRYRTRSGPVAGIAYGICFVADPCVIRSVADGRGFCNPEGRRAYREINSLGKGLDRWVYVRGDPSHSLGMTRPLVRAATEAGVAAHAADFSCLGTGALGDQALGYGGNGTEPGQDRLLVLPTVFVLQRIHASSGGSPDGVEFETPGSGVSIEKSSLRRRD